MPATPGAVARRPRLHRRAVRHVGRGAHHLLRWVGSIAAVLILVTLFGIWRLMQGPIELDWLAPYVEAGFARAGTGFKLAIAGVRFGFDRTTQQLELRAENVRVSLPSGEPVASFPEMSTGFAAEALLLGRLMPTQVVIERPVVHLVRDPAGTISAQIGASDQSPALGPQMLEELAGPPGRDSPLGLLRRLRIRGATVIVDDRRSGRTWQADRVDIAVQRSDKGARGDVSLALPIGNSTPELHASYRYFAERRVLDLEVALDGLRPADIPPLVPEIEQLRHIEAPVAGTLRTRIDLARLQAQGSRLDLTVGQGRFFSHWLPEGSIALDKGEMHAVYAPETAELRIEQLALDLGGGTNIAVQGSLAGVTPELIAATADARPQTHLVGRFAATLNHVPAADFARLWPVAFSPGGRRWVLANVHDGVLDQAALQVGLDLDPAAYTASVLNANGSLRYRDLTVNYFDGLPPVRKVDGTASFSGNHVDFVPAGGLLNGLRVTGGTVRLSELGGAVEWLSVDASLAGSLQDALQVLDAKPLHYAHAIGVDPARIGGRAETQLHFKLPLLADLKLASVEYGAKATITGASLAKAALDRNLEEGNFGLDITRTNAHLKGTARFDDIPVKLDANIAFHPKDGLAGLYRVGLTLDDQTRRRLDIDVAPDRLRGPIAVDVTYSAFAGKRSEASAVLDLRDTNLAIPEAGWKKAAGQPATAKIAVDLDDERITRVRQVEVRGPGLDGRFAIGLANDRQHIDRVDIHRLAVGDTSVTGTVSRRADGGWRADIHAARLDASHLLKDAMSGVPTAAAPSPPLALNLRIDRLFLGPQRELHQVAASLLRSSGTWQAGHLDARYANGRQIALRFGEGGGNRLYFQSDDFGAALRLFDIGDNVAGGQITIDGELSEVSGRRTLRGHIDGRNYTIVRAPIMARVLALPSFTGLASTLSGSGLPFSALRGDFVFSSGRISFDRLLAFGESLGITANGWVDIDQDRLELQGTVAPAYALNSILGNVPIIGQLLVGGSQGLFAANYRLSGATANPQVTVNPLSALAPGILRQLFAPITGVGPSQPEPQSLR